MNKLLVKELPPVTFNGKWRKFCIVKCPSCLINREVRLDAYKQSETTYCRSCTNLQRPTKDKKDLFNWIDYYRSEKGKLAHLYQGHVARSRENGWEPPSYTREELTDWGMNSEVYLQLFNDWKNSGYLKHLSPSIDRLDDYKPYSFENIQITTWDENNRKGRYWQKIGKNNKNNIAVDQLDMEGSFIKRFHSISAAARELGVDSSHIGNVCKGTPVKKGGRKTSVCRSAGGFIWRYSPN